MEVIQKRIEKRDLLKRCYINYPEDKVIIFKDIKRTKVDQIVPVKTFKRMVSLNSLIFLQWL